MTNEILSYLEVCQREGMSLQKGMNFKTIKGYSIILMSVRPNAPYNDRFEDEGTTLIYEGHDAARSKQLVNPKLIDQPRQYSSGSLTENGKFHKAAQEYKSGLREAELVRVYEKIKDGIWSYNGVFRLVDSWQEKDQQRAVFKFKLLAIEEITDRLPGAIIETERRRIIPTSVKLEVWKRDNGKCVKCGATDELHFDHIIPFSMGGTSLKANNIQLLCARHNLQKSDNLE